jgi:hypothetical protein
MKKTRNRKTTKRQISARLNINLLDKVDMYIEKMNKRGITIKKVDIMEKALFEYMEKLDDDK